MKTPILCVVACLIASVVLAQGLGEASRKEQERRKKAAEAGAKAPTYGNAELLEATEGKGTFSADVADPSGDSEMPAPVAGETVSMPPPASPQTRAMCSRPPKGRNRLTWIGSRRSWPAGEPSFGP
jgi:hypothetical protein